MTKLSLPNRAVDLSTLTFNVDMDSVLCDWDKQFRIDLEPFTDSLPENYYTDSSFDLFSGLTEQQAFSVLSVMNRAGFYSDLQPIDGAVDAVRLMIDMGIDVAFVTSPWYTNPTCMDDKKSWLNHHIGNGFADRMIISKDKTRVRGTFLIDDKPHVTGKMIPEWEHIYFTQRYNAHLPGRRINAWDEWENTLLS
jgi:5'-nucleotidase